jgi:DNA helicase HerA-like ATPase
MIEPSAILGRRILITGEVNTGKTTLTKNILESLCRAGAASRIVIVDMAPEVPEEVALKKGVQGVGGKLLLFGWDEIVYLATRIRPPRLSSKTEEEALSVAEKNRASIDVLFRGFQQTERDILFLNDVSMYLQMGSTGDLLKWIGSASTVVANGYYGCKLGTGPLSMRESAEMELLMRAFPYHVRLPGQSLEEILSGKS